MFEHLIQRSIRMFGSVYAYYLNLVKLMQTVQSAYILSVRTGFTTETCGISTTLDRQIFFVENLITEDICYRYLCCRNKEKVVNLEMIHLSLFVRQLACTVT